MQKEIVINVDSNLLKEADEVLNNVGLDLNTVLSVLLKKVVRKQNVLFLFEDNLEFKAYNSKRDSNEIKDIDKKITKTMAISLFRNEELNIDRNVNFSTKNKSVDIYWVNPNIDVLKNNWNLILNDPINRLLYLFVVEKNSIGLNELQIRLDRPNLLDIRIMYGDNTFYDTMSGYMFNKHLTKTIKY